MTYSEKILQELIKISDDNKIGLFEAAAEYCEAHDLDQGEFISQLDPYVILRLKEDAISERKVRKCVHPVVTTIF